MFDFDEKYFIKFKMVIKSGKIIIPKTKPGVIPMVEILDNDITTSSVAIVNPTVRESSDDTRGQMEFYCRVDDGKLFIIGELPELFEDTEVAYFIDTDGSGGGGAGDVFTNVNPMPESVGGLEAGTTFNNVSYDNMWNSLLYPYQYPNFSSFYIDGKPSIFEVGDSILPSVVFKWSINNNFNVEPNSISIYDVTDSLLLGEHLVNDGSENISLSSTITYDDVSSHSFRISADNNKSESFELVKTYRWYWRMYYGEDDDAILNSSAIKSLRVDLLTNSFARTYSFNAGGYKYLSWPVSFGQASSFKDVSTNLDVPFESPYIISITNDFGKSTDFYVYRTTNILGGSINIRVS